ncbi:MAG: hypothetical protein IJ038_04865 [Clostridia bacterium]|nr:hypothetical protein [Clostridia bacterium]
MYVDIFGKKRQKIGLHIHTTRSDGAASPDEALKIYKEAGYDAVALTDHWLHNDAGEADGLGILSGAEYNIGGNDTLGGVYHILGLLVERDPEVLKSDGAQTIINKIHAAGGIAVLAHPAWSLNTPDMIMKLDGIDATEIYNAVSAVGESFRADSSIIVDMLAVRGVIYPLLATDDTHFYNGKDNCVAYIMAECDTPDGKEIKKAILEKRFYATQGPEIHLTREDGKFTVRCSPVSHIYFASGSAWCRRSFHGEKLTFAEYKPISTDRFVRAFVIDGEGRYAWSNIISVDEADA